MFFILKSNIFIPDLPLFPIYITILLVDVKDKLIYNIITLLYL